MILKTICGVSSSSKYTSRSVVFLLLITVVVLLKANWEIQSYTTSIMYSSLCAKLGRVTVYLTKLMALSIV